MKKNFPKTFTLIGILSLLSVLATVVNIGSASSGQAVERPFRMQTYGVVVDEGPNLGNCPFVTVLAEGEGNATHMGLVSINRTHCFDPTADTPISDGYWEAVAANGDKIWGSYEGTLVPTDFNDKGEPIRGRIDSPYTIDGGTGRFEGASGSGVTTADYDLVEDAGHFVTEGVITY